MLQQHRIDRIRFKVWAVNEANKVAAELYPKLAAVFTPLVGQKILKADGTILEKYKRLMPELPNTPKLNIYRYTSDYNIMWKVNVRVWEGDKSGTHETSVYVGKLNNGVLEEITPELENRRTDWTTEEVVTMVEVMEARKKAYEDARSPCYLFDEGQ